MLSDAVSQAKASHSGALSHGVFTFFTALATIAFLMAIIRRYSDDVRRLPDRAWHSAAVADPHRLAVRRPTAAP